MYVIPPSDRGQALAMAINANNITFHDEELMSSGLDKPGSLNGTLLSSTYRFLV